MSGLTMPMDGAARDSSPPRAVILACRWCGFLGADRAGRARLDLPPYFRLIPVECTAAVDPDLVLRALADGIHGVAVLGCHLGGCRHNEANRTAELRLTLLQDLLDAVGLDRRRLLLSWGTAHEADQFARLVRAFAATLAALPTPAPGAAASLRTTPPGGPETQRATFHPAGPPGNPGTLAVRDPAPEAMASIRDRVASMLGGDGTGTSGVVGVLGMREQDGTALPYVFSRPEEATWLTAGPKWPLAKTAWRLARALPPDRGLGLVCRGCDARAVTELEQANQLRPGTVRIVGIPCPPELAEACQCAAPYPPDSVPSQVSAGPPAPAGSADDALPAIDKGLSALTAGQDRLVRWREHFSRCLKCYGCRNACPICTCPACKLEDGDYVPLGGLPPDPLAFHLIRVMHLADRCVACGACQEACPAGLPLLALHRALRAGLQARTGFVSGSGQMSPLLTVGRQDSGQPRWTDTLAHGAGKPAGGHGHG